MENEQEQFKTFVWKSSKSDNTCTFEVGNLGTLKTNGKPVYQRMIKNTKYAIAYAGKFKWATVIVKRLVAQCWLDAPPDAKYKYVHTVNGDESDVKASNLRWSAVYKRKSLKREFKDRHCLVKHLKSERDKDVAQGWECLNPEKKTRYFDTKEDAIEAVGEGRPVKTVKGMTLVNGWVIRPISIEKLAEALG